MTTEQSEIGQTLQRFLDWAREQGWRYDQMPFNLNHFQGFLQRRGVRALNQVDTALLVAYQRQLQASRSASTVNGYLSSVRVLWRYLLREGVVDEDVTKGVPRLPQDQFIPYLYDAAELARIERALQGELSQIHTPARRFCRRTRQTAFGLLRDCGLRVSEACRLDVQDYDPQARSLRIERTKFFKTRVIPLPRSTCARLDQYLVHRQGHLAEADDPQALFLSMFRQRLDRGALESPWKALLEKQGLYQPRRRQDRTAFGSTNLHSLRHSFAVRTLERWQREGDDVEQLLPLLSGYMGHVKVTYTATYLHLTPTLRRLASERFGEHALPRLDHCGALGEDEQ
jgi:integrase/recombinase XerD